MRKPWVLIASLIAGFFVTESQADTSTDTVSMQGSTSTVAGGSAVPAPVRRQANLNEIKGKFQSLSEDPRTIRLLTDAGFSVEFPYDSKTTLLEQQKPLSIKDLSYNDEITVRYAGKELYAIEIERLGHAARPN